MVCLGLHQNLACKAVAVLSSVEQWSLAPGTRYIHNCATGQQHCNHITMAFGSCHVQRGEPST